MSSRAFTDLSLREGNYIPGGQLLPPPQAQEPPWASCSTATTPGTQLRKPLEVRLCWPETQKGKTSRPPTRQVMSHFWGQGAACGHRASPEKGGALVDMREPHPRPSSHSRAPSPPDAGGFAPWLGWATCRALRGTGRAEDRGKVFTEGLDVQRSLEMPLPCPGQVAARPSSLSLGKNQRCHTRFTATQRKAQRPRTDEQVIWIKNYFLNCYTRILQSNTQCECGYD